MPSTPVLQLPYPLATDPADVPVDMGELATRLETVRGAPDGLASLGGDGKVPAAQLPAAAGFHPHVRNLTMTETHNFANPTAWTALPGATDRATLTTMFGKAQADTQTVVQLAASLTFMSGAAQSWFIGMSFNGTIYELATFRTETPAPVRIHLIGFRGIGGMTPATYSTEPVVRSAGAAQGVLYAGIDFISYIVQETP